MIGDDVICSLPLLTERKLTGFAALEFVFVPASSVDAGQPGFKRNINKDNCVAQIIPTGFQHDGSIENDEVEFGASLLDL